MFQRLGFLSPGFKGLGFPKKNPHLELQPLCLGMPHDGRPAREAADSDRGISEASASISNGSIHPKLSKTKKGIRFT